MRCRLLSLTNFRNYRELRWELPAGPVVLFGRNAEGKTNLLEALYLCATSRSFRTQAEGEMLLRALWDDPLAVCRVACTVEQGGGESLLEVVLVPRERGTVARPLPDREESPECVEAVEDDGPPRVRKLLRVNGVPRRSSQFLGCLRAVLFSPQDIEVLTGGPGGRRRLLDLVALQLDPPYLRQLRLYAEVLRQRNSLLKRLQGGIASPEELAFWDSKLVEAGSYLTHVRARVVGLLARAAEEASLLLSLGEDSLRLGYRDSAAEGLAAALTPAEIRLRFERRLRALAPLEWRAGTTLVGPHRDDLSVALGGVALASYGSRGQQRTAAVALRLAEARATLEETGTRPALLLDDVLSELDARRQAALWQVMREHPQVIITTTHADEIPEATRALCTFFAVERGILTCTPGQGLTP